LFLFLRIVDLALPTLCQPTADVVGTFIRPPEADSPFSS
jgi:hypothetical protein